MASTGTAEFICWLDGLSLMLRPEWDARERSNNACPHFCRQPGTDYRASMSNRAITDRTASAGVDALLGESRAQCANRYSRSGRIEQCIY